MRKLFVSFLLLCFFLSGCADYNELNMQELVRYAGVDFSDGEVSVSVITEGGEKRESYLSRGESFFEAVREMSGSLDKKLWWGHAESIVFGEAALSGAFEGTVDAILRARDVYLDIVPISAKNMTAAEIVKESVKGEADVLAVFANEGNSRHFKAIPLWRLLREREMYGVCVIPTVEKRDGGFATSGGAVISEKGFLGYLSENEFLFRSLLTDETAGGYLPVIPLDSSREVSFEILGNNLKVKKAGEKVLIEQEVTLSPAEVRGEASNSEMQEVAQRFLEDGYKKLISDAQKRKLGNIFKLSEISDIEVEVAVRISNVLGGG